MLKIAGFIAAIVIASQSCWAASSLAEVEDAVHAFLKSEDAQYAPKTAQKAQAMLGAAYLAQEQGDETRLQEALNQASSLLHEARQTSAEFRRQNPALIRARNAAQEASKIGITPSFSKGEALFRNAVEQFERGSLNESKRAASMALAAYTSFLKEKAPELVERTASLLAKAAAANGKQYAPETYQASKKALEELRAFANGDILTPPAHPLLAQRLASKALAITKQVKQWRRHPGSHEQLVEQMRKERLKLAVALGLSYDPEDPIADVDLNTLVQAAKQLNEERKKHLASIQQIREECQQRLQVQLEQERQKLESAYAEKVSHLREAFSTKLERETFEQRRLEKLKKLFSPNEAKIYANVDGSILIRLTGLQFQPGKSQVDPKDYDLLKRVKKALEIYNERRVRIEGHTDNRGDFKKNQLLSLKRAEAVRDVLITSGIDAKRLTALGYGEARPIASNEFEKGRAMNRRIDIVIEAAGEN